MGPIERAQHNRTMWAEVTKPFVQISNKKLYSIGEASREKQCNSILTGGSQGATSEKPEKKLSVHKCHVPSFHNHTYIKYLLPTFKKGPKKGSFLRQDQFLVKIGGSFWSAVHGNQSPGWSKKVGK